jgi:hypothetical protein
MMKHIALALVATLVACTQEPPTSSGPGGSGSDPDGSGSGSDPGGGGGSGSGSDPGGSSLAPEDFIAQLVGQECTHAFTCMAQYPTTTGTTFDDDYGTDQNDCVTSDDDYGERAQVAAAVAAGKITYDATSAAACLADMMFPASCTDFFTTWDWPDSCYDALAGNVADGAACTTGWECGDDSDCTAGKCAPSTDP